MYKHNGLSNNDIVTPLSQINVPIDAFTTIGPYTIMKRLLNQVMGEI